MLASRAWFNTGLLWPEGFIESLETAYPQASGQERSLALRPAACPCFLNAVRLPGFVFFFFYGSTLAKMCFDKPSFHRAHLLTYMRVKINESIKAKECDPTRRFPVTSLNQLLHAEAPWPPGSHRLSLSRRRAGYGDRWGC